MELLKVFVALSAIFLLGLTQLPAKTEGAYYVTLSLHVFIAYSAILLALLYALIKAARGINLPKGKNGIQRAVALAARTGLFSLSSMALAVILIDPIEPIGMMLASVLSGAFFLLANLIDSKVGSITRNKNANWAVLYRHSYAALLVCAVTIASLLSAISLHQLSSESDLGIPIGIGTNGMMVEQLDGGAVTPPNAVNFSDEALQRLWFSPQSAGKCVILAESVVFSFDVTHNCVLTENGWRRRIYCPVFISLDEVKKRGEMEFLATGACEARAKVIVTDGGFLAEG